jgi:23S rRNA (uridine2552-2'-O)-methyltransferase
MVVQGSIQLSHYRFRKAFRGNRDDWVENVANGPVVFLLLLGLHGWIQKDPLYVIDAAPGVCGMKKSKTSQRWLTEHEQDPYVLQARIDGYRSRAVYKLIELDERLNLFRGNLTVVDLGAAPGGWSQVARQRLGASGRVLALDILEMAPIEGVEVITGDFTERDALAALEALVGDQTVDLVISDMAPNLSGVTSVDLPRSIDLIELAMDFAKTWLRPGGHFVAKAFEGEGIDTLRQQIRMTYDKQVNIKPKASRGRSREIYLVGLGKK